ncbi:hypothetical protein CRG98_025033 [Punica granatum]|uniref:Uncharacterized protein n=1 Tax=Punica granatum TaxID=22663 RepID=A0A2I0JE71_PUNGR|nr:hypothetical protein CRG98_025033 [Punica granatum]
MDSLVRPRSTKAVKRKHKGKLKATVGINFIKELPFPLPIESRTRATGSLRPRASSSNPVFAKPCSLRPRRRVKRRKLELVAVGFFYCREEGLGGQRPRGSQRAAVRESERTTVRQRETAEVTHHASWQPFISRLVDLNQRPPSRVLPLDGGEVTAVLPSPLLYLHVVGSQGSSEETRIKDYKVGGDASGRISEDEKDSELCGSVLQRVFRLLEKFIADLVL